MKADAVLVVCKSSNNTKMKENKKTEELQSRREFFKQAAKKALPIIGAIALANVPLLSHAAEKVHSGCNGNGCKGTCEGGCYGGCRTGCENGCGSNCLMDCEGHTFVRTCFDCKGSCSGCNNGCKYSCQRTCKNMSYTNH